MREVRHEVAVHGCITPRITCGPGGRAPCARPFESAVRRQPARRVTGRTVRFMRLFGGAVSTAIVRHRHIRRGIQGHVSGYRAFGPEREERPVFPCQMELPR